MADRATLHLRELPGWASAPVAAAFSVFRLAAQRMRDEALALDATERLVLEAAVAAGELDDAAARAFFEQHFIAQGLNAPADPGLLTGYYEPEFPGSLVPSPAFPVPLHRRPDDLEPLVDDRLRGAEGAGLTYARRTDAGLVPYFTRAEIAAGALADQGLELAYVRNARDAFVIQVQGSGRLRLPDGTSIGLDYDGKNGHPYTSIGRALIDEGHIRETEMTMSRMLDWLAQHDPDSHYLMRNRSYVFFKMRTPRGDDPATAGPVGAFGQPLVPMVSLAVDASVHRLGLPVYISGPDLAGDAAAAGSSPTLSRLMIAHDVGSAIKGAARGDIFCGDGPAAADLAGSLRHPCRFFRLVPDAGPALGERHT